jgi:hypothetical protein
MHSPLFLVLHKLDVIKILFAKYVANNFIEELQSYKLYIKINSINTCTGRIHWQ